LRHYLDTSLVVTALVTEPSSEVVLAWLDANRAARLIVSDWVVTEFSAALCVKLRSHQIHAEAQESALAKFGDLIGGEFDCLPLSREHFRLAATFANRSLVGLRAGDALHLAIAATHSIKLCTRDRRLAEAGTGLGVLTEYVSSLP
jgi:predicted nucleic acid-binding protein